MSEEQAPYGDQPRRLPPTGFTQVDNVAILDTALPPLTRLLYVILRQHRNRIDGRCCPAYDRLCALLGSKDKPAARTTVAHALRELFDAGLLAWEKHGGANCFCFPGDPDYDRVREVAQDYFSRKAAKPARRSSAGLLPKLSTATSEVAQDYLNNTNRTRRTEQDDSAPTERDAPGKPAVPARAEREPTNAPANESALSTPKRSASVKASADGGEQEQGARRAARPPTNAIQRVEQGIKAAGLRPVVNFGRDGKQLADLLAANPEVTAEDVIACYVAIATSKYGDEYMRQHLTIAFVCTRCINGYLNWRLNGGKAGGVGRVRGTAGPARSTSVSDWDNFDYDAWERQERARRAPAGDEAG